MDLLPFPRDPWRAVRLHPAALLLGLGTGLAVMLLLLVADAVRTERPLGVGAALLRAVLVYFPAGLVAGLRLLRVEPRRAVRFAPGGVHGAIVGMGLAFAQALVLLLVNDGHAQAPRYFAAEALLVAVLAAVAGGLAGDVQRRALLQRDALTRQRAALAQRRADFSQRRRERRGPADAP